MTGSSPRRRDGADYNDTRTWTDRSHANCWPPLHAEGHTCCSQNVPTAQVLNYAMPSCVMPVAALGTGGTGATCITRGSLRVHANPRSFPTGMALARVHTAAACRTNVPQTHGRVFLLCALDPPPPTLLCCSRTFAKCCWFFFSDSVMLSCLLVGALDSWILGSSGQPGRVQTALRCHAHVQLRHVRSEWDTVFPASELHP